MRTLARRVAVAGVAAAIGATALALAGCAASNREPEYPGQELNLGVPGEQLAAVTAVGYYPACGNEVLVHEGTRWYPFTPANLDDFPSVDVPVADAADATSSRDTASVAVGAVVAPGPGDDVGTLVLFGGGFAYWESTSGDLSTWLTTEELTYRWVC